MQLKQKKFRQLMLSAVKTVDKFIIWKKLRTNNFRYL